MIHDNLIFICGALPWFISGKKLSKKEIQHVELKAHDLTGSLDYALSQYPRHARVS